jgi:creatinine amidohydrolase/Fe(II)-dependent formamide hydrolase-like protein
MPKSVMWKELTAEDLRAKAASDAIVVLPVASMEQHGPHLPVGVDTILCEGVCKAGAEKVATDLPVVVAPTLWCGMAEHHMAFGGTFTFDIPTYRAVLLAFLNSIDRHGFKRVLIVNGHGGNSPVQAMAQDWMGTHGEMSVRMHNWWNAPKTWAVVKSIDPVCSHASWMENFPWTRVPGFPQPTQQKPMASAGGHC